MSLPFPFKPKPVLDARGLDPISPVLAVANFLAKGPRYIATYTGWRLRRALEARRARTPAWPELAELLGGIQGGDGLPLAGDSSSDDESRARLRAHFRERTQPKSLVSRERHEDVLFAVPRTQQEATRKAADAVVELRFDFRGQAVRFEPGAIDWTCRPENNHDWMLDFNRHHFFVTLGRAYAYTGDERYARTFEDLLRDWMRQNPPGVTQPNWRGVFEVATRMVNWCWAHAFFVDSPHVNDEVHAELLRGLLGMGRFLLRHIEVHAWNNHLLVEAKALAMVGLLYPEIEEARSWARRGLRLLHEQLARQVSGDGVHSERSSHYHKLVTSELLELAVVLELAGREAPEVVRRLRGLSDFLGAITRTDGSIPMLGDSSRHDEHIRFEAVRGVGAFLEDPERIPAAFNAPPELEEANVWLLAAAGRRVPFVEIPQLRSVPRSRAFPRGGYWVLRGEVGGEPIHMVFDCGPFSDPIVYGHGHADALSVDLSIGNDNVLVDPGVYSTHLGSAWRNFFRGTSAHNTVQVDGRDQTLLEGTKRAYRRATAHPLGWLTTEAFDYVTGEHSGYERLRSPVSHRRQILFMKSGYFLVLDEITGCGTHEGELFFHLLPGWKPQVDGARGSVEVHGPSGRGLAIVPLETRTAPEVLEGEEDPPQGWVAFESGVRAPAPVLRYRAAGVVPLRFATLLVPLVGEETSGLCHRPVIVRRPDGEVEGDALAGRVSFASGREELFLVRRSFHAGHPVTQRCTRPLEFEGVQTDGRLAFVSRSASGKLHSAAVIGGSKLSIGKEELFSTRDAVTAFWYEGGEWKTSTARLDGQT